MPTSLQIPDDAEAYVARVPDGVVIRGMFFGWVQSHCTELGVDPASVQDETWHGFRKYPVTDYIRFLVAASMRMFPKQHWTESVRLHGRQIFDQWTRSMVGKSVLAGAMTTKAIAAVAPRTYPVLIQPGTITVDHVPSGMLIQMKDLWSLNEYLQLGIWERLLASTGATAEIEVESLGPSNTNFHVRFTS